MLASSRFRSQFQRLHFGQQLGCLLQTSSAQPRCSKPLSAKELKKLLSETSWSVKSLQGVPDSSTAPASVTREQLHHLLRLSALPIPESAEEETRMIKTLELQLRFVQAIQSVDAEGVPPLAAVRDETKSAIAERTVTLETLREDFEKEESTGVLRRIIRKRKAPSQSSDRHGWDPLESAPSTHQGYISTPRTTTG